VLWFAIDDLLLMPLLLYLDCPVSMMCSSTIIIIINPCMHRVVPDSVTCMGNALRVELP
jgi:hypothetical protein